MSLNLDSELIQNDTNENLKNEVIGCTSHQALDTPREENEGDDAFLEDLSGLDFLMAHGALNDDHRSVKDMIASLHPKLALIASGRSPPKSIMHFSSKNAFPNAVSRLRSTCVPCRRPCTGIKLLELINHRRRLGYYGLCRRNRVLNTVDANAETLIDHVEDNQREGLETLVKEFDEKSTIAWDVTQAAGFISAFHAEFPLQDADLASVGFKGTSDKNWRLYFNEGQITKKSVSATNLIDFLKENDVKRLRSMNSKTGVVTVIYSVTGGLTYVGDSGLVTTGGVQVDPTPTGPVKIMAGCQYMVNKFGQVILFETNRAEWIIGIEFLELGEIYEKKELPVATQ